MNRIDEEEEEEEDNTDTSTVGTTDDTTTFNLDDRFSSIQSPPDCISSSIYPSKQTSKKNVRSKYQTTNRTSSLPPSRHSSSLNENISKEVKQRRRYASDSNTNNTPTLLVTSFLQYLRNELRVTTSDNKNDYQRHIRLKSSSTTTPLPTCQTIIMNSKVSNENLLEINDHNEILTLVDLLVLRVECLTNENKSNKKKKSKEKYPTVAEVDQNLIEYLYYLFTKFVTDDTDSSNTLTTSNIDKKSFLTVCQTLVRNGCFDMPSPDPDQSISDTTTSASDQTITPETFLREYNPDSDKIVAEKSTTDEQETWLIVELEPTQSEEPTPIPETICIIPTSTSDEQLLLSANDKSYDSESSPSIYLSPNGSIIDLQIMVQEFDEINNQLIADHGSTLNVIIESKTRTISNDDNQSSSITSNNICTRLTNDDSSIENTDQIDKMLRREKKMQERWSLSTKTDNNNNNNNNEQSSPKPLIGIEFPQISVLRRKFSSSPLTRSKKETNTNEKIDSNPSTTLEEINTSSMISIVDNTNPDQINESPLTDLSLSINTDVGKNNDDGELHGTILDEEITMKKKQDLLSSSSIECQTETITNNNNELVDSQQSHNENSSIIITNPLDSNSLLSSISSASSSSPPLISISSSSLTLTTNENNTVEPLVKEKEEEKEEEQRCNDDYNLDEEKKNNSSFVYDYHASGIILINDEPTQTALLKQEKKEKEGEEEREQPSPPLLTLEQFNQQRTEDESPLQTLSNDLNQMAMTNIDENEERYKKVEIEEIPDDEEAVTTQNIDSIEPTDYIHTDDEPRKKSTQSNISTTNDDPIKFDNIFSCYEKVLSKVGDTSYDESLQASNTLAKEISTTNQQTGEDPIALRALQRFQERMNAAAAAVKTTKEEPNSLSARGKSSWSGSLSTPRKSLENLFKSTEQQLRSTPVSLGEESTTVTSSIPSDSYIRPRKAFDDNSLTSGLTSSTIDKINNNDDDHVQEEQQQPSAIVENDDKRVVDNKSMTIVNSNDQQEEEKQQIVNNTTIINETNSDNSNFITDNSQSLSNDPSGITTYRFQLEGRRRLNTLERLREHRQSRESLNISDEKQQQIKNDYTLKSEEIQDPIIRRALERFDEKNRTLTQTKSMNYDEIQDPITRRALMRLESNLKKTIPSTTNNNNNSNENWYTENYTLGSLQPTNDRLSRYTDSSQSPLLNNNNKTKYISVHQHYCTPSSNELSDVSTTNEQDIPVMHVPTQPIYVTSNNQPLSLRQRSRSEDMLTSKDLTIGQTTNLDDVDTSPSSQLQRNQSSNEIALNESDHLLPNTLIKTLEPNFVRTTESTVSYVTPTQTYSAYSCEYTRPRRNPLVTTSETLTKSKQESNQLPPSTYSQQQQNEIQRPTPYRPTQTISAFAPVESSTATTTSNYYGQQPLSTSSYDSMYTPNNFNQSAYSEDPIIRRALERFNSQMQNSLLSTSQYQPTNNYLSRQGNFQDSWTNTNRPTLMTTSTSSTSSGGYQSIIGRRRHTTRQDDSNNYFVDNPSVGDGYSTSLFYNSQNSYPITNHYMNMSDEPPIIPPRFRRDNYRHDDINDQYRRHSTDEYLSENLNNNNNNSHTIPRETFIHHAYPATITNSTGFRPINLNYNQLSSEQDDLHDRAQSTSSTNSSDSLKQQQQRSNNIRTKMNNQQRLPPSSVNEQILSNNSPSDQTTSNNGSVSGDSVFHRLAYTGTKASLSRSSSNSCSNLLNKNSSQPPSNQLKPCEIDFDDSLNTTIIDQTNEQQISTSSSSNKYQRSKSVDTRARLKLAHIRSNDNDENNLLNNNNDEQQKTVLSSKFTPINTRQPPRVPLTPTSTPRTLLPKRPSNGIRSQGLNGNLYDTDNQQQEIENDENISFNDDNYQPKLIDNRIRANIPVHRYTTNNNIQTSTSASSVNSNISRTKPPNNLDRRDSNTSITDSNRISRRLDDNRLISPTGQRRNIPVSVFAPAKLDNKRPAPAPPTYNYESQQQASYLSRLSTNENEMNNKKPTGNLLNEYNVPTDKHDHAKKMNVFERLFRSNKKKN